MVLAQGKVSYFRSYVLFQGLLIFQFRHKNTCFHDEDKVRVFWVVMMCGVAIESQCFGGPGCLSLHVTLKIEGLWHDNPADLDFNKYILKVLH
jgi:hypothetical protein